MKMLITLELHGIFFINFEGLKVFINDIDRQLGYKSKSTYV